MSIKAVLIPNSFPDVTASRRAVLSVVVIEIHVVRVTLPSWVLREVHQVVMSLLGVVGLGQCVTSILS